jgi:molybdopterin-guanine dinucleotide biosynthesis protein A
VIDRAAITGVILCGGDARRLDGVDKPLLPLGDRPLVAHVHERLAPQVARVLVSANRSRDAYAAYGDAVVPDAVPGRGPLGGLATILASPSLCATPHLFACPGDAPFLDPSLVSRLAHALEDADADAAIPHDGARAQHVFLLLRVHAAPQRAGHPAHRPPSASAYLDTGARSVHGWLATRRLVVVDATDLAPSFVNVNTPRDLEVARRHWSPTLHLQQEPT